MRHIVFVESRDQVSWLQRSFRATTDVHFIALTADAMQAFEEMGLSYTPISMYATTYPLADVNQQFNIDVYLLAQEIEAFIGQRVPSTRFEGPGFLSGQAYTLQYSISAIAKRAYLMREAIRVCKPNVVNICHEAIDSWFEGSNYTRNPWVDVIESLSEEMGYRFEILQIPSTNHPLQKIQSLKIHRRIKRFLRHRLYRIARSFKTTESLAPVNIDDLHLLLVGSSAFDWQPVVSDLLKRPLTECYYLEQMSSDPRWWMHIFSPTISDLQMGFKQTLDATFKIDLIEQQKTLVAFAEWIHQRPLSPSIEVLGMNIFPPLEKQIQDMVVHGPAIVRYTDLLGRRLIDKLTIDAVCFFSLPLLIDKRLAYYFQQQGIPTVSYQHGFGYSIQIETKDEQCDPMFVDYFLTYGPSIRPRADTPFPPRARYIPVGSARIERMAKYSSIRSLRTTSKLTALWLAESSNLNTLTTSLSEDTKRYQIQKQCLEILGGIEDLQAIYRPYIHCMDFEGTTRWLQKRGLTNITINITQPLEDLIRKSDVVIMETSSPTAWAEVLGLQKPMILYCDPLQTLLTPEFAADLEQVCHWCKTEDDLKKAVTRLAMTGKNFVSELQQINTSQFVKDYVLHDGQCVSRVISFLNEVCRNKKSVDVWEGL